MLPETKIEIVQDGRYWLWWLKYKDSETTIDNGSALSPSGAWEAVYAAWKNYSATGNPRKAK